MPVRRPRNARLRAMLIIPLAAALAACGSSGSGSGSGPGAAASVASHVRAAVSAATHGSTVSAGTGSGSGKSLDVCTVLTAAHVGKILGTTFGSVKPRSVPGIVDACEYSGGDNLLQVTVQLQDGPSALSGDVQAATSLGHPPASVSGVGDKAFAQPDPKGNAGAVGVVDSASYGAVFGGVYIKIGGMYVTPEQGKQIVELLHAAV